MCRELTIPFDGLGQIEKDLVFDFVGYFSRLEYSMKRADYFYPNGNRKGDADWDTFINNINDAFVHYDPNTLYPILFNHPPMKQIVDGNGEMGWRDVVPVEGDTCLKTLSRSLRRARNNLFHGGKYHGEGIHGFDRCNVLLRDGIAFIKDIAPLDNSVLLYWNHE